MRLLGARALVVSSSRARALARSRCHTTATAQPTSSDLGRNAASPASVPRDAPVVVLLGWLMCQERHLRAYERMYHSAGIRTMLFIPPWHTMYTPERRRHRNTGRSNQRSPLPMMHTVPRVSQSRAEVYARSVAQQVRHERLEVRSGSCGMAAAPSWRTY